MSIFTSLKFFLESIRHVLCPCLCLSHSHPVRCGTRTQAWSLLSFEFIGKLIRFQYTFGLVIKCYLELKSCWNDPRSICFVFRLSLSFCLSLALLRLFYFPQIIPHTHTRTHTYGHCLIDSRVRIDLPCWYFLFATYSDSLPSGADSTYALLLLLLSGSVSKSCALCHFSVRLMWPMPFCRMADKTSRVEKINFLFHFFARPNGKSVLVYIYRKFTGTFESMTGTSPFLRRLNHQSVPPERKWTFAPEHKWMALGTNMIIANCNATERGEDVMEECRSEAKREKTLTPQTATKPTKTLPLLYNKTPALRLKRYIL